MKMVPGLGIILLVVLAMSSVVKSGSGDASADEQAIPVQWEYKVIPVPQENGIMQHYQLQPKLNDLGKEGWECTDTLCDVRTDTTHGYVILKRIRR